jgi:hypothetical protein
MFFEDAGRRSIRIHTILKPALTRTYSGKAF